MEESRFTADEMMTIAASRMLRDGAVCFVGIGLPSAAANLARLTHAPDLVLIYESGTIGAKPQVLPLSIGDGELSETADAVVSIPEIFSYWLQGSRVDIGFLGAAQIDRFGNINTTVIGDYRHPSVRLPGAGGAPEIALSSKHNLIMLRHNSRALVERLDFISSAGFLDGGRAREQLGMPGGGPAAVVTDLGILTPEPDTRELWLTSLHPAATAAQAIAATGWPLKVAQQLQHTPPPTAHELNTLRQLNHRTRLAHAGEP